MDWMALDAALAAPEEVISHAVDADHCHRHQYADDRRCCSSALDMAVTPARLDRQSRGTIAAIKFYARIDDDDDDDDHHQDIRIRSNSGMHAKIPQKKNLTSDGDDDGERGSYASSKSLHVETTSMNSCYRWRVNPYHGPGPFLHDADADVMVKKKKQGVRYHHGYSDRSTDDEQHSDGEHHERSRRRVWAL